MAVNSQMLELGTPMPPARLPDVDGATVSLQAFDDAPALLVVFLCKHCPFVQHVKDGLIALAEDYRSRGLATVGICANDWEAYPDDAPHQLAGEGYPFPVLFDEGQDVAKAFRASCTPDFFLFDADRQLVYRGQMDDSRPSGDTPVTGSDLRAAVEAVLEGRDPDPDQKPSVGCSIKWRAGSAPVYSR